MKKKKKIFSDFYTAGINGNIYIYIYNEKRKKKILCRNLEGLLPKSYCERWIVLQY